MLREPARFLSRFFKYEFEPDAGVHSSGTAGKYRSEGLDRYISSRNASAMWEVAAIERFLLETDFLNARANTSREADFPSAWREYTEVFGDPASARRLLRGVKIVGFAEASTETFYEPLCELLQLPSDACIAASKAETQYSHVNLPHPQIDNFSPSSAIPAKNLAAEIEVYDAAKAIAGERRENDNGIITSQVLQATCPESHSRSLLRSGGRGRGAGLSPRAVAPHGDATGRLMPRWT